MAKETDPKIYIQKYISYLSEWLSPKSLQITNADKDADKREPWYTAVDKLVQPLWRAICKSHQKIVNRTTIYDPATLLLGIYTKKKNVIQNHACTPMLVVVSV